jgi:DNA-binding XRE family transcriptional regulator
MKGQSTLTGMGGAEAKAGPPPTGDYSRWTIVYIAQDSSGMSGARNQELIKAFARVLRQARAESGMTQEELAHRANVDRTFIGLLETAKRQPSLSVIFALARALGMAPELLIARSRKTLA